jgi:hypothetical protein
VQQANRVEGSPGTDHPTFHWHEFTSGVRVMFAPLLPALAIDDAVFSP